MAIISRVADHIFIWYLQASPQPLPFYGKLGYALTKVLKEENVNMILNQFGVYIIKGDYAVVVFSAHLFYIIDELVKVKYISFYGIFCSNFRIIGLVKENIAIETMDFSNLPYLIRIKSETFRNEDTKIKFPNLQILKFGSSNILFEESCFYKYDKLTEINFKGGNHKFEENAFSECGITTLTLPGDNNFESYSFARCKNLTILNLPNQTTQVDFSDVFNECNALITLESDNPRINAAFEAFTKTLKPPGTPKTSGGRKPSHSKKTSKKKGSKKKGSKKGSKKTSKKKGSKKGSIKKKGSKKKT